MPFGLLAAKDFFKNYLAFQSFDNKRHPMKVIPETRPRRAH